MFKYLWIFIGGIPLLIWIGKSVVDIVQALTKWYYENTELKCDGDSIVPTKRVWKEKRTPIYEIEIKESTGTLLVTIMLLAFVFIIGVFFVSLIRFFD